MNHTEAILDRKSVRTYTGEAITGVNRAEAEKIIKGAADAKTPFGTKPELSLVSTGEGNGKLGTYGFISGAVLYAAGACVNSKEALMDLGYALELAVLGFTAAGIGTCWLGGTFTRESFSKAAGVKAGMILPCVISMGYQAKRSVKDRLVRMMAGSDGRHPYEKLFFIGNFNKPTGKGMLGIYEKPLEAARLAPSASNKQPWRMLLTNNGDCQFFYEKTAGYAGNSMGFEMQRIDIGIVLSHFELACREAGISGGFVFDYSVDQADGGREYILSWKREVKDGTY